MATIPLSKLTSGADAGFDSRTRDRDKELPALMASIEAHGLLQPLLVGNRGDDGGLVIDGNRRLRALQELAKGGIVDPEIDVEVVWIRKGTPLEASLAANTIRRDIHPVDRFEAFAALDHLTPAEIAERFNMPKTDVARILALGRIAKPIREAWAKGEISEAGARNFTLCPDPEKQVAIFKSLKGRGGFVNEYMIRHAVTGEYEEREGDLKFVGVKAYKDAGGALLQDLFSETRYVQDPDILTRLRDEKLADRITALKAEGWAWVAAADDPGISGRFSWAGRLRPRLTLTPEQQAEVDELNKKNGADWPAAHRRISEIIDSASVWDPEAVATAGATYRVSHSGEVSIERGFVRPGEGREEVRDPLTNKVKQPKDAEPAAVLGAIREQQTRGIAQALAEDPTAAKIALIATLWWGALKRKDSPISITIDLVTDLIPEVEIDTFADMLAHVADIKPSGLDRVLALFVGSAFDSRTSAREGWAGKGVTAAGVSATVDLIDPEKAADALLKHFDPADYFEGAKKDHALQCIAEIGAGDAEPTDWTKRKKPEVAARAAGLAMTTGWLPKDIRPSRLKGGAS